ncbi:hypothetical protein MJN51_32100, partial [Salmonella enterica subsp. enterica serovar Kentucky]|nr:hypothetical protein [Salmonella enterica subsp. enterica serovar Kentucky]
KAPFWVEKMPEIPELVYDSLRQGKYLQHSVDKIARELQVNHVHKNPDIVAGVAALSDNRPYVVGFAAETNNVEEYARQKRIRKNL